LIITSSQTSSNLKLSLESTAPCHREGFVKLRR